ncbi:response regulator [[Clostridium] symbiosum]|uniref:response regulator n=1 Tax=Clostridium symbiosum TaxID=1512 RepID=UPI00189CD75B|nr:response regulator [[Clostridium] symbiosum]MDB2035979.1 response regulator [[Clostridium] symbiosum]
MLKNKLNRYQKLAKVMAVFLLILLAGYYIISASYTNSIIGGLENIKEHPFPVAIAAGKMETNSRELRLTVERLCTDRTIDTLDEVKRGLAENQGSSNQALETIVSLYLTDPPAAVKLKEQYNDMLEQQEYLIELCEQDGVSDETVMLYVKENIIPLLDEIDTALEILIHNAILMFDTLYLQSLSYKRIMFILTTVLISVIVVTLLLYRYVLSKREVEAVALQKQIAIAAQAANDAKSQFLSSISHDIRTPMNAIIGMTTIASTRLDDKEQVKDCLNKIATSSRHLLGLINDVLDMSKIENGKFTINKEPVCLSDFMHDFISIIQPQVKAKHLELDLSILGIEDEIVITDSLRLHQIMQNIMSNAIKFTRENGKISLRMEQAPYDREGYSLYVFRFSDNGIGMSEEFQKVIFQPFERAATSTVSKTEGTGLGMSITKSIVDLMGGSISVTSRLNEGTTFTVSLPMQKEQQKECIATDLLKDLRCLIVDDDRDVCENTVLLLKEIGMHSEWVLNGADAVVYVESAHKRHLDYNAVILDWQMPDMDGIETARRIRNKVGDTLPIIILSAYDWTEIEDEAREVGITAFLAKPLFKSRLYETMRNTLMPTPDTQMEQNGLIAHDKASGRILLVEDNTLNAEIAQTLLTDYGLHVDVASDGNEALEFFRADTNKYDIIFMDVQMPVMDGYHATAAIRDLESKNSKHSHTVIIGMSANAFKEDVDKALACGMDDYITKPIDIKKLQNLLRKFCKP